MSETPHLALPYIAPGQAQKHVTHNEAIRALDAIVQLAVIDRVTKAPPPGASAGDRYLVPDGATGAWAGYSGHVAALQDGAWAFFLPKAGWRVWVLDEAVLLVFDGAAWTAPGAAIVNPVDRVGVNTTADLVNRLAVKSDAILFSHDDVTPGSGDCRQVLNKATTANVVSQLYQTGFSARAETGLAGDDNFHIKVSPDGNVWHEAIIIDGASGEVSLPNTAPSGGTGPGAAASGNTGEIQFNTAGAFDADPALAFDAASGVLSSAGLSLDAATDSNGAGMISLGPVRFAHAYGSANTFFGANAGTLTLDPGSAIRNTALGDSALPALTTGSQNMAFGWEALNALTTGKDNAAMGARAMRRLTTGNNNVGIGANALDSLDTGTLNVGIGRFCGQQLTSGASNVFIGYVAGGGIETGGGNVVIGGVTGLSPTLSQHIVIGTGTGTVRLTIDDGGHAAFEGAVRPQTYTVATLPPAATAGAGAMVFVGDTAGGPVLAFSDGTDWRRSTDRAVVA